MFQRAWAWGNVASGSSLNLHGSHRLEPRGGKKFMFKGILGDIGLGLCFLISPGAGFGAGSANAEMEMDRVAVGGLTVTKSLFGKMRDGMAVDRYTFSNIHHMQVGILSYGGIVQSVVVPDKDAKLAEIALGFDNLESYVKDSPYFGAIIGRYGNRIAKGEFTFDGKGYQIPTNNGPNSLHGGRRVSIRRSGRQRRSRMQIRFGLRAM